MIDFSLNEISNATKGRLYNCDGSKLVSSIVTDSRKIVSGCVFVAIKGEKFDGHTFSKEAVKNGAMCVISEEDYEDIPYIKVENSRRALIDIARAYRIKAGVKVVGVTGSVGKTTTKDILYSVIKTQYNTLKTEGNFNNDIGLPLTVFNLEPYHEVAILEMGMNNFGEIKRLSYGAIPDISLITNIGISHIENLGSREGILKAKSEIFEYMKEDGFSVLNGDDDMLIRLKESQNNILYYGIDNKSGIYADNIKDYGLDGIECRINTNKGCFNVFIGVPGRHMVYNALAATQAGLLLNISIDNIKRGIEEFIPTKMRMDIINENGIKIINDTYNANPVSMKAALDVLSKGEGVRVAIIGDMFELGDFSDAMHYDIGRYAANLNLDSLIFIGKLSKAMERACIDLGYKNYTYFENQEDFLNKPIDKYIKKGYTVLVKASRGMNLEKTVAKILEVK